MLYSVLEPVKKSTIKDECAVDNIPLQKNFDILLVSCTAKYGSPSYVLPLISTYYCLLLLITTYFYLLLLITTYYYLLLLITTYYYLLLLITTY